MPYIDPLLVKLATVTKLDSLSLAISAGEYAPASLIFSHEDTLDLTLEGEYVGYGTWVAEPESKALIIEGVAIEVDPTSVVRGTAKVPLQVVRQGGDLGVYVRFHEPGRVQQTIIAKIDGDFSTSQTHERFSFSRWRIVHGTGRDKVELLAIDTSKPEFQAKPLR